MVARIDFVQRDAPGRHFRLFEAERAGDRNRQTLEGADQALPFLLRQRRGFAVLGQARLCQNDVAEPPRQVMREDHGQLLPGRRQRFGPQPVVQFLLGDGGQQIDIDKQGLGFVMAADDPAHVENDRTGQTKMREQQRATPLGQFATIGLQECGRARRAM